MDELTDLIAASHTRWTPQVVQAVLGTNDPASVAETLTAAVATALGGPVAGCAFYDPGVGIVVGFEMVDGRRVVAKVHRPTFVSRERLLTIARVQAALARSDVPAPKPLAGPLALGEGWLTIEELLDGDRADGYDPGVRRAMAAALHGFVDAARHGTGGAWTDSWPGEPVIDGLWPEPHDLRFDLSTTASGAEWIDDAARVARAELETTDLPDVVGHLDWRVQNLAFAGDRVCAIYDWDSVGRVPEPAVVGCASVVHPVDWRLDLADPLPTLDQIDDFVAAYESARGAPFDADERAVLVAAQTWIGAYGARCQHSDDVLGLFPEVDHSRGWPRLLRELLDRSSKLRTDTSAPSDTM